MHLFPAIKKEKNLLYVAKSHRHHIVDVLRVKIGEPVKIIYQDKIYECKFHSLKNNLICKIIKEKEILKNLSNINIFIGLIELRPLKLLIEKLTELNVEKVFIVKLMNSNSYLANKIDQKVETLIKISKNAQIQSNCTSTPEIIFLDNINKILDYKADINFFCDVEEQKDFLYYLNYFFNQKKSDLLEKEILSLNFIIGCEAGFTENEKNFFLLNNFFPLSLGNNILRAETAAIAVSSKASIWRKSLLFFKKNIKNSK
ncbi:RsmE family RNA methyltransferase [symbiont of Argiope bruennichi]|uniref:RsmE family RNA methyltransferase n=1 Tax=symbiont of Argiope bruennichi TaxID=2810479 RepID=UPI003DA5F692